MRTTEFYLVIGSLTNFIQELKYQEYLSDELCDEVVNNNILHQRYNSPALYTQELDEFFEKILLPKKTEVEFHEYLILEILKNFCDEIEIPFYGDERSIVNKEDFMVFSEIPESAYKNVYKVFRNLGSSNLEYKLPVYTHAWADVMDSFPDINCSLIDYLNNPNILNHVDEGILVNFLINVIHFAYNDLNSENLHFSSTIDSSIVHSFFNNEYIMYDPN
jgi:hypothetical protein